MFFLLIGLSAFAQTDEALDSLLRQFHIDEVEVTAKRHEETILPVQRLEGAQLEALSAHSVADAVRYFSGVQIKDYGGVGGLKTVDVRSMGSHHLGVFYDGIEVGNAQNGTVDLGRFSMENVEQISLYNGQKTELLQSAADYASAGTLYIRTRRPKFAPGKNYHVVASMKAGTFGLANPSVQYEQKLTDNIHLSLSGEYLFATGRYTFRIKKYDRLDRLAWDTVGIRQNGDINAQRAEAGVFGYLNQGKWHVKAYCYHSERGIPRAIVKDNWTSEQRQWDLNTFVQGQFQKAFGKRYEMQINAKYAYDYLRFQNADTVLRYFDNSFYQHEAYVSMANKVTLFPWWALGISADYRFNHLRSDLPLFIMPSRHTELLAVSTSFDYKWIRAQLSGLATFVQDRAGRPEYGKAADQFARFTPTAMLGYQPLLSEDWYIRAFYKEIFRMPTFNDLYYTEMGNKELKPEYTRQYDFGSEWIHNFSWGGSRPSDIAGTSGRSGTTPPLSRGTEGVFSLKADAYFNQVTNKIIAVPQGNSQYRWMMLNLGYVEIFGLDLNSGIQLTIPTPPLSRGSRKGSSEGSSGGVSLSLSVNYTYQRAKDMTNPADTLRYGGQISYIPRHSGGVNAGISWCGWGWNYAFIYVGERYHNSANIRANYEQPWYTHDLALSKLWQFKGWRMSATVEVNNLLNQQYDVISNYPMPGTNGKLILKFIL